MSLRSGFTRFAGADFLVETEPSRYLVLSRHRQSLEHPDWTSGIAMDDAPSGADKLSSDDTEGVYGDAVRDGEWILRRHLALAFSTC